MNFTRRETLAVGAGAALAAALPGVVYAAGEAEIEAFTGGASVGAGGVTLTAPEIAENGNTVPIQVAVESPMTADDHVAEVLIVADGNPRPDVAVFKFTEMSGEAQASTRIRLAKTQNVIAVAKMSDGSFFMAKNPVKVTIGGCGG